MNRTVRNALLVALLVTVASAARAEVFEIGRDGALRVRTGAGAVAWSDADAVDAPTIAAGPVASDVPPSALTLVAAADAPAAFQVSLNDAARRYGVSAHLLAALVWHESRWQPAVVSNKGAIGLAQLMPATARALAVDPYDAAANLSGAAHYLRNMLDLFDGDVERALAAYSAGPGRVRRANGIPAIRETQAYVTSIMDRLARQGLTTLKGERQ